MLDTGLAAIVECANVEGDRPTRAHQRCRRGFVSARITSGSLPASETSHRRMPTNGEFAGVVGNPWSVPSSGLKFTQPWCGGCQGHAATRSAPVRALTATAPPRKRPLSARGVVLCAWAFAVPESVNTAASLSAMADTRQARDCWIAIEDRRATRGPLA